MMSICYKMYSYMNNENLMSLCPYMHIFRKSKHFKKCY